MKKKLKFIGLMLFFSLGILMLYNCSPEHLHLEEDVYPTNVKKKKISFNEFKNHSQAFNKFKKIEKKTSKSDYAKFESDSLNLLYNFTIDLSNVLHLQYQSLESFTFAITREIDNGKLENLVISKHSDGNYYAKILKYTLTSTEQAGLENDNLTSLQNPVETQIIGQINFGNSIESDCGYTSSVGVISCGSGIHNGSNVSSWYGCTSHSQPSIKVITTPIDCSGGGGGGGGGGDGTSPTSPDYPTSETPVSEYENGISEPIKPNLDGEVLGKTPCSELTKLTESIPNKEAIETLKTKTTENKEYGYSLSKNIDNTYSTPVACNSNANNPDEINMPVGGNKIGAFHTHPYVLSTNTTNAVPMFSDGDLNWLFWVANQHTNNGEPKEYSDYFLTLTVPQGTFAIKIKDWTKFAGFRNNNNYWTNLNSTNGGLQILTDAYDNIGAAGDFNSMKNALLKVLFEADTGIGLYEASSDLSSWNELTLTTSNYTDPTTAPLKKPCL